MSITAAANEGTDQASRMLNQGLEPRLGARVLVPGGKNPPSCEPAPLPLPKQGSHPNIMLCCWVTPKECFSGEFWDTSYCCTSGCSLKIQANPKCHEHADHFGCGLPLNQHGHGFGPCGRTQQVFGPISRRRKDPTENLTGIRAQSSS